MRRFVIAWSLAIAAALPVADPSWSAELGAEPSEIFRLGARMAAAALREGGGEACKLSDRCDRLTGCIPPPPLPGPIVKILPEGWQYDRHVRDLRAFQACRELVLLSRERRSSGVELVGLDRSALEARSFADAVLRWNGDIFWKPASASSNVVTRFGDEARAVFGPIPEGDCAAPEARTIPVEVEGHVVDLVPNPGKPSHPLEFEHRDIAGKVVKWTEHVSQCDKPSLAGEVTYCGLNSRLNRVVRGNVEWLFLCRKSSTSLEVSPTPYWQRANPKFARLGTIGFNRRTGEIVFFDGRKDRAEFDWSEPFVPPGGRSYADRAGRAAAEALYDPTFEIQCFACHDNKNAYVIDPHIQHARVGHLAGVEDPIAVAFSLGDYLPQTPREEDAPFRVIGSGYTSTYAVELGRAKTVRDPSGNCTECHTLTTQVTGQRFAPDAVGREPSISRPSWAQTLELLDEQYMFARIAAHRTDWALRSGPGKIHPWMVPEHGNDLAEQPREISAADWQKLSDCLWGAGGPECGYRPLYTACPAPGAELGGDDFGPIGPAVEVLSPPGYDSAADRVLRIRWRYLNSYGGVPRRDDVRFNVAIKEAAIPMATRPPAEPDYPDMYEAQGLTFTPVLGEIGSSGSARLIRNVSYAGHKRWTEPTPSTEPREFRIDLPATCNRRYLVRILPKRFCFDQSDVAYSSVDHLLYADILCD